MSALPRPRDRRNEDDYVTMQIAKGHDGIHNYDAYRVDFSASIFDTVCFYKDFFISLCYFNQFDTTSKVMYRHEIICAGNTV